MLMFGLLCIALSALGLWVWLYITYGELADLRSVVRTHVEAAREAELVSALEGIDSRGLKQLIEKLKHSVDTRISELESALKVLIDGRTDDYKKIAALLNDVRESFEGDGVVNPCRHEWGKVA